MTAGWNLADIFETIGAALPDKLAQVQGERAFTWRQLDGRANALATDMLEAGLGHQVKVAAYLHNCPEYLETYLAAFKVSLVPVNTNYRYGASELKYLWQNADIESVIFHASYAQIIDQIRHDLPAVKRWYAVADGSTMPNWAHVYEDVVNSGAGKPTPAWSRSGDDLLLLYTGGTTGMPKGVMWRQDDLFNVLGGGGNATLEIPPVESLDELSQRFTALPAEIMAPYMPACPLMHGTGQFGSFIAMFWGRTIVCLPDRKFSAHSLWEQVAQHRVGMISIVGDAFARPMLDALDKAPSQYDVSCVTLITSSGVMWSQENKNGLLRHMPQAGLMDALGSSEAVGLGNSLTTADAGVETADFVLGDTVRVFAEGGHEVKAGDQEIGQIAVSGFLPVGYYKDKEKTDKTFRTINDVRYSIPGDFAKVNADGSIKLLGRGSVCINTGGEKVFPEEVEEALKQHDLVVDAVCVGVPNERFGQTICAVIEPVNLAQPPSLELLNEAIAEKLAHYKVPRHLIVVDSIGRAANGKVDYKRHTAHAQKALGLM